MTLGNPRDYLPDRWISFEFFRQIV